MSDLNKLKAEAHLEYEVLNPDIDVTFPFIDGWDACMKAMEKEDNPRLHLSMNFIKREYEFTKECKDIAVVLNLTSQEIFTGFLHYWTEPNKSKTKMRFELERTWDTKRRLQTWIRNDKKFNPKKEYNEEKIKMPAGYGKRDSSYWTQRSSNHEPKKISELIKK